MLKLAEEIMEGRRLTEAEDLSFFETVELEQLRKGADRIREHFFGNKIHLCTIINGRAGRCSEDCKFCAQSAHNHTNCEEYDVLDGETVLADCRKRQEAGIHAYSIVTAGRRVQGEALDKLEGIYRSLRENCDIDLCASLGFVSKEALVRLKQAGVTNYHCNLETSRNYFPNICTTHSFDDKIEEIRLAQSVGFHVCSGGIIGMGESFWDRIDMALELSGLGIHSIPINSLMPIKGTPLQDVTPLTTEEILRTVAMFRYVNPEAWIRIAAGRSYFPDGGRELFRSGANATITGDMLTTVGNKTAQDREMFAEMGFCM